MKLALLLVACAACSDGGLDEEWGMNGPLHPLPPPGKEDGQYHSGLAVATDTSRTQVWDAVNKWQDTDTAAARAAGIAWGENSGLTWDEKFSKWVQSLEWAPSLDGFSMTVNISTPWGKTLPSPMLECAETSLFLRIAFASWYGLPLQFESIDDDRQRVYFGHFGVRTANGRYAASPEFGVRYHDYTNSDWHAQWPEDTALQGKLLAGGEDNQRELHDGAVFGAYVDQIFLNKRVGYFVVMSLNYLGSMNLADTANTYNLLPEAVHPGDFLIERWQKVGIGHTLVVKEVNPIDGGNLDVTLISGSMPRRQGVKASGESAKSYFTSDYTGGPGMNSDGDAYAKLGGGLKRWRVAKNINGYWTNTWMNGDEANWINSTDYDRIAARPARFQQLLGQVSPEQQVTELQHAIDDARHHLAQYPASCSAREQREHAFEKLYEVESMAFGKSKAQVDADNRKLEDYVFANLDYSHSKTCCWDSSTSAMYEIIIAEAQADQAAAEMNHTCVAPVVFESRSDGYARWASYAQSIGRGADWKAWSEDEPCAQRDVASDTEAAFSGTAFCSLGSGGGGTCTDPMEPNDSQGTAKPVSGTVDGLQVCAGDSDWYSSAAGGTVRIEFTHAMGDLDMAAYDATGSQIATSQGTSDSETVQVPAGGFVRVYGYNGATNTYRIVAP
jgi:hypothetical protein